MHILIAKDNIKLDTHWNKSQLRLMHKSSLHRSATQKLNSFPNDDDDDDEDSNDDDDYEGDNFGGGRRKALECQSAWVDGLQNAADAQTVR